LSPPPLRRRLIANALGGNSPQMVQLSVELRVLTWHATRVMLKRSPPPFLFVVYPT